MKKAKKRLKLSGKVKKIEYPKVKRPEGRPTKYDPSMIGEVSIYLSLCGREQTRLPLIEDFAMHLGVDDATLWRWGKKHHEFCNALLKISIAQKLQLVNDGIYGGKEVNSPIVKLLLQNNHGMKERTDHTTDDKPLPTPIYGGKSVKGI